MIARDALRRVAPAACATRDLAPSAPLAQPTRSFARSIIAGLRQRPSGRLGEDHER